MYKHFVILIVSLGLNAQSSETKIYSRSFKVPSVSTSIVDAADNISIGTLPGSINEMLYEATLDIITSSAAKDLVARSRGTRDNKIFEKNSTSVVLIIVKNKDGQLLEGSGSIIDRKGFILTNQHVIRDADRISVFFKPSNSQDPSSGKLVRNVIVDKYDEVADLATLKAKIPNGYQAIPIGDASDINIGMDVYAIGHPKNGSNWSFTKGIVSQIANIGGVSTIQTQTPITYGNSGGPLINESGQLIGVNSGGDSENVNMNYAISVSEVMEYFERPYNRTRSNYQTERNEAINNESLASISWQYEESSVQELDDIGKCDIATYNGSNGWSGYIVKPRNSEIPPAFLVDRNLDGETDVVFIVDRTRINKELFCLASQWDTNFDNKFDLEGVHVNGKLQPISFARIEDN